MAESRDLNRVADLLSLQGAGVFVVDAVGAQPWLTARFLRRTLPALEYLLWEREPTITAVPLRRAGKWLERVESSIVWARTGEATQRTKPADQVKRLRNFRPRPSVVLREGGTNRYVAFWALLDPLPDREWLERANKRIAYNLGTPQKWSGPEFTFHLPGSVVRTKIVKKKDQEPERVACRPYEVELVRFEPDVVRARDVVGRLKDPPEPWKPDWLKEREAAARAFSV